MQAAVAEQEDGFMTGDPKDVLLPALQGELRKQALMASPRAVPVRCLRAAML